MGRGDIAHTRAQMLRARRVAIPHGAPGKWHRHGAGGGGGGLLMLTDEICVLANMTVGMAVDNVSECVTGDQCLSQHYT